MVLWIYCKMQISQFIPRTLHLKPCRNFKNLICRTIYTAEQLSVEKYVKDRERLRMSMQTSSIGLKKDHIRNYLRHKNISTRLFVNDLTQFLHLIDNTDEDFVLLDKAMEKFRNINAEHLGRSNIGNILMKMLHHFRRDEPAQKFYNDSILKQNFLSGKRSMLIYFDLLYKQKKYTDLLRQFDDLRSQLSSKQQNITRSIYVLIFATCYSQNTAESYDYATQLHEQNCDAHITQDHLVFLSALALNQNAPNMATKYLSTVWPTAHIAIASLRLNALLQMRRFGDSLQMLRSILVVFDNGRAPKVEVIALDVIQEAEKAFQQFCEDERLRSEFHHLRDNLNAHGYIVDKKLAGMIFEPFRSTQMTRFQKNRMFIQAAFDRNHTQRS